MDLYMSTMPWPPFLSSRKWWPPKLKKPGSEIGLFRPPLAQFQRGQRHEGLEGGAGRVGAVQARLTIGLSGDSLSSRQFCESMPSTNRLGS
jgi:hypothetical protein